MNIPEWAIEKAIEGGWQSKLNEFNRYYEQAVALDPTFWQALGKALGWGSIGPCEDCGKKHFHHATRCKCGNWLQGYDMECPDECDYDGSETQLEYEYQAHRFYDFVLTSDGTEKFWNDLLV